MRQSVIVDQPQKVVLFQTTCRYQMSDSQFRKDPETSSYGDCCPREKIISTREEMLFSTVNDPRRVEALNQLRIFDCHLARYAKSRPPWNASGVIDVVTPTRCVDRA